MRLREDVATGLARVGGSGVLLKFEVWNPQSFVVGTKHEMQDPCELNKGTEVQPKSYHIGWTYIPYMDGGRPVQAEREQEKPTSSKNGDSNIRLL